MPEPGLFDTPLSMTHRRRAPGFPIGWLHHQVTMPRCSGVDAVAGAVQFLGPDDSPDHDVPVAAAVRHWCGEDLGQLTVRRSTAADLAREGAVLLRLDDLDLHDPALLEHPGCPLVPVGADTPLLWATGTRHRQHAPVSSGWVPYGQVVVRWLERDSSQPVAHTMNMTGLGAAGTREAAIEQACAELIAQDAVMTWWLHGGDDRPLSLPAPVEVLEGWDHSLLDLRLRVLPSTTGCQVVLAIVRNLQAEVVTVAPAAGPNAVKQAIAQALWQQTVALDLLSSTGGLHRQATPGVMTHRADRSYLTGAGPDLRLAVDPLSNVQLGLDPAVLSRLDERTAAGAAGTRDFDSALSARDAVLAEGRDLWVVDLTTPDVAEAGWNCVRVIATDLARIPVAAFGLDPAGRTARAARVLGMAQIETEPLPYPGW
jgi:thiazole/oxazole-forming peptide maturase SagD family component